MSKKQLRRQEEEQQRQLRDEDTVEILQRKTVKDLIAPAGIDASNIDHMEILIALLLIFFVLKNFLC